MLAGLRFPPERSRGRRFPEPAHPYRGPFQRDRDRVIHSRAFRRLEHKTQVFTAPHSDHFRNRLTHTLEVSQVARTAAAALGLNEDLVECLALAHDLGHPAFGHAGEEALDREMRRYGAGFDHNRHALRIVERFEQKYAAFRGLNLTFEVREGLLKHSCELNPGDDDAREYLPELRPLLEAQLIDPADEIAYLCADLDDAVDSGFIDVEDACGRVAAFGAFYAEAAAEYPSATAHQKINEAIRRLLGRLVFQLIEGAAAAVAAAAADGPEAVRRLDRRVAVLAPEGVETARQLRALLQEKFYGAAVIEAESSAAAGKLGALFRHFMQRPEDLPQAYREQTESEPLHQAVCDYIAGMTDKFLLDRFRSLAGIQGRPEQAAGSRPAPARGGQ